MKNILTSEKTEMISTFVFISFIVASFLFKWPAEVLVGGVFGMLLLTELKDVFFGEKDTKVTAALLLATSILVVAYIATGLVALKVLSIAAVGIFLTLSIVGLKKSVAKHI